MESPRNSRKLCFSLGEFQSRWLIAWNVVSGFVTWNKIRHAIAVPLVLVLLHQLCGNAYAGDLPPRPSEHFNDYDSLVKPRTAEQLNKQLADYERQTSNQLIVVIYAKLPTGVSIGTYGSQLINAWKLGQGGKDNGAILLVDDQDHLLRIEAGHGLKVKLPESTCRRIFSDVIMPRFKVDDFDGGLKAGVSALIVATSSK